MILVLVGIAATLGVTPEMAAKLSSDQVWSALYTVAFGLIAATVLALGGTARLPWPELGLWLGTVALALLVLVRINSAAERTHLIEYGILAAFVHEALLERWGPARRWRVALVALVATIVAGLVDEVVQAALPNRYFDWRDLGFNAAAASGVIGTKVGLARLMRRH